MDFGAIPSCRVGQLPPRCFRRGFDDRCFDLRRKIAGDSNFDIPVLDRADYDSITCFSVKDFQRFRSCGECLPKYRVSVARVV